MVGIFVNRDFGVVKTALGSYKIVFDRNVAGNSTLLKVGDVTVASLEQSFDSGNTVKLVNGVENQFWVYLDIPNKKLYFYDGPNQQTGANIVGVIDLL